jgi:hypothetical protein
LAKSNGNSGVPAAARFAGATTHAFVRVFPSGHSHSFTQSVRASFGKCKKMIRVMSNQSIIMLQAEGSLQQVGIFHRAAFCFQFRI